MDAAAAHASALRAVVRKGSPQEIQRVDAKDAEQWRDPEGRSLLFVAVERGQESQDVAADICQFLVREVGVDVNLAASSLKQTALFTAAIAGLAEVVRTLLDLGAEISYRDANGQTPLFYSASHAHPEVVDLLLRRGGDAVQKDWYGLTCMYWASKEGTKAATRPAQQVQCIRSIIKAEFEGAGGLLRTKQLNQTALFFVVQAGLYEAVAAVLDVAGANINDRDDNGQTAIFYASNRPGQRTDIVQLLLDRRADVTVTDNNRDTALHYAVGARQPEVCRVLLHCGGADAFACNSQSATPMALSLTNNMPPAMVEVFQDEPSMSRKRPGLPIASTPKRRIGQPPSASGRKPQKGGESDEEAASMSDSPPVAKSAGSAGNAKKKVAIASTSACSAELGILDLEVLKDMPSQVDQLDSMRLPEVHKAALRGFPSDVEARLRRGCDAKEVGPLGRSALFFATMRADDSVACSIARILVQQGEVDVNEADDAGQIPIFHAARAGLSSTLRFLIEANSNVNHVDQEGWTALHHAAGLGMPGFGVGMELTRITVALLEAKASITASDSGRVSPLTVAAVRGREMTLQQLFSAEVLPHHLTAALREADPTCVRTIIRATCDPNEAFEGLTDGFRLPLCVAAARGQVDKCEMLVEGRADVNAAEPCGGMTGMTCLHAIVMSVKGRRAQEKKAYERLLNAFVRKLDANPLATDSAGKTAGEYAYEIRWHDGRKLLDGLVKVKQKKDAELEEVRVRRITEVMMKFAMPIIQSGHVGQLRKLLKDHGQHAKEWGAVVAQQQALPLPGRGVRVCLAPTLLHQAANSRRADSLEFVKVLVEEAGFQVTTKDQLAGETALFRAAGMGKVDVCRYLIEARADVQQVNTQGTTAAFVAAARGTLKALACLIELKADVHHADNEGRTPASFAAHHGQEESIRLLAACRADVNAVDSKGRSPLYFALRETRTKAAQVLLAEFGAGPARPGRGKEKQVLEADLFQMARERGLPEIVLLLQKAQARQEDEMMLSTLAGTGQLADIEALAAKELNANAPGDKGLRPLHRAAARFDSLGQSICKLLLEKRKADPNVRDDHKETPLFFAARSGSQEVSTLLLEAKCDPSLTNTTGETALFEATRQGYHGIVAVLLEKGAKADIKNRSSETPLFHAIDKQSTELLLKYRSDPGAKDGKRQTALFVAAMTGRDAVLAALIKRGAKVDAWDAEGRLPLHVARGGVTTDLLISAKANIDAEDDTGNQQTPLAAAAARGDAGAVQALLAAGADGRRVNAKRYTALQCATMAGASLEVVGALVREGFPPDPMTIDRAKKLADVRMAQDKKDPVARSVGSYLHRVSRLHGVAATRKATRSGKRRRRFALCFEDPITKVMVPYGTEEYCAELARLAERCPLAQPAQGAIRVTRGPPQLA